MFPLLLALLPAPAVLLDAGADAEPESEAALEPAAAAVDGATSVAVSTGVVETADAVLKWSLRKRRQFKRE